MRARWRPASIVVVAGLAFASPGPAAAQPAISDGVVKIGLILDLSGPYSETTGTGSAAAARMAVEDFGGKVLNAPIEVLVADHHNSPDQALSIARRWFDMEHVDAIMDVSGSSEALIVQRLADTRHKIVSLSAPGALRLSNEACTATAIHYAFDTRAIANTVAGALVARGEKSWFFITVDYSFGYDLEHDTAAVVEKAGGTVIGRARHPLSARDFESYLARARESGAQVVALADAGSDLAGVVQQAADLGMIPGPQMFAALVMRINGVHELGLPTTQGMILSESFYWDLDDATRAWSKRFFALENKMPNSLQAGVYSSTMHYLQAIARTGTDATDPVMKAMRDTPINDFYTRQGQIRADGVMVHDMHLFEVKKPEESRGEWDYYKLLATVAGERAFGSLAESKCPLVKQ